jgi:hypothetical protein
MTVLAGKEEYKKCLPVVAAQYTYSELQYDVTLDVNIGCFFNVPNFPTTKHLILKTPFQCNKNICLTSVWNTVTIEISAFDLIIQ